jgi:hypothetical protein
VVPADLCLIVVSGRLAARIKKLQKMEMSHGGSLISAPMEMCPYSKEITSDGIDEPYYIPGSSCKENDNSNDASSEKDGHEGTVLVYDITSRHSRDLYQREATLCILCLVLSCVRRIRRCLLSYLKSPKGAPCIECDFLLQDYDSV